MDGRIWAGIAAVLGIAAALSGPAWIAGLAGVAVFAAVFLLSAGRADRWFLLLAAGGLLAVAAGLSSPLFSLAILVVVLGGMIDGCGLFGRRSDYFGFLAFAVAVAFGIAPLAMMRHVYLPSVLLLIGAAALGGAVLVLWYRLAWTSQRGEP
ncbi:hypothetical protein [Methanofollis fontis]|uniref:Uncharacterized protein n=1 Tax=Methanofollis fontis TaxID=2052832 RepID=A0A483CYK1_9EURY|nr:hypothetical protein [Methanofollis fontis]TAJ45312.1 hypothetical protein CUJ86_00765 [Methanofollis fontis]